jgi:hypothetical protein
MGSDGKLPVAKKLWSVIERHNLEVFTVRDLWQKVRRRFSVEELEGVLRTLEQLGYLRRLEMPKREGRGKPPSPSYEVNPCTRTQSTQCTPNKAQGPDFEVF